MIKFSRADRDFICFRSAIAILCAFAFPTLSLGQIAPFEDDEDARRIHDRMNAAFESAETLSFVCKFEKEALGVARTSCTYHVWLKKPNLFRIEVQSNEGHKGGVMVGDGVNLWVYWPNGRPRFEGIQESAEQESTRLTSYMKKNGVHANRISIWHELPLLGYGIGFPVLDVSAFHGFVDVLSKHVDAIRGTGSETIDGLPCDKIEISMLDHQRSRYLWISEQDHFPRRLVELARVDHDVITTEVWSSVQVDEEIADSRFRWNPPDGWHEWKLPDDENYWPTVGSQAADFDLASVGGGRIRLSDYRGKVVWLNFWRIGCPPCVEELPYLESMHTGLKDAGLVIIGVNVLDDRKQLAKVLDKVGITYPNVLDASDSAKRVYDSDYGVGAIPLNCIVDRDGVIVDVWVERSEERATRALRKAGIKAVPEAHDGG